MHMFKMMVVLATLGLVACGGGNPGAPSGSGNGSGSSGGAQAGGGQGGGTHGLGTVTATIDNVPFQSATAASTNVPSGPGYDFTLTAADTDRSLLITFHHDGPGTYATGQHPGMHFSVADAQGSRWATESSTGHHGTITLTIVTANRMAGTFSFSARPFSGSGSGSGSAGGTRVVTNGSFDLGF